MPLTAKGKKILAAMKKQYDPEKGKQVFYASQKTGTITGTHNPTSKDISNYTKRHGKNKKTKTTY